MLENLGLGLFFIALGALISYGIVGAVAEHDYAYNLTAVRPVKIYSDECGHILGLKEYHSLCEVK